MINEIKKIELIIPPKDIYYVSWIIDACEGIGFLQTDDAKRGKITIFTPYSLACDVYSMIDALITEGIPIEIIESEKIEFAQENKDEQ